MGVWIETNLDISAQSKSAVTPCMGVWIETRGTVITNVSRESHPVWVCGLKPVAEENDTWNLSHTLYGCVD